MYRFLLLAGGINYLVVLSEVNESESIESQVAAVDEPDILLPALGVELDQILTVVVIDDNHAGIVRCTKSGIYLHVVDVGACCDIDLNTGVQVFQLGERCLGTCHFADVLLLSVEVAAELGDGDEGWVVEGYLFGACQDEILRYLYAELC